MFYKVSSAKRTSLIFTLVYALIICVPTNSEASFNPLKAVGDALGGVARGVGNIFGQGIAGLASPSINAFADQANRVLAENLEKADKIIGARINQVDNLLSARITQVDTILTDKLNEVDKKIGEAISRFDGIMDQKIGAVDIVATKAVQNAEDSLVSVLRFGAILVLAAALIFVVARALIMWSPRELIPPTMIASAVAAVVIAFVSALGVSYLISPPAGARVTTLEKSFKEAALAAFQHGELNDAAIYAKQLTVIDPTSVHYGALQKVAEVQRDVLYRPTTLKSVLGANELLPRVRRLEQYASDLGESASSDFFKSFISEQTSATSAMVLWQLAKDKLMEGAALCAAADALQKFTQHDKEDRKKPDYKWAPAPFTWFAYSYVRWGEVFLKGTKAKIACPEKPDFFEQVSALKPTLQDFEDRKEPPATIAHVIKFNRAATNYFAKAAPLYTAMILHDAGNQLRSGGALADPTLAGKHKQERNTLSQKITNAWNDFVGQMKADLSLTTTDIGMAAIGVPAALAIRAQQMRIDDPSKRDFPVATCKAVVKDIEDTENSPALAGKYSGDLSYGLASLYNSTKLRSLICDEQSAFDKAFYNIEKDLTTAVKAGDRDIEAQARAKIKSDVLVSLTMCVPSGVTAVNWTFHEICTEAEFEKATGTVPNISTKPFVDWLWASTEGAQSGLRYAMIR
jgi:hypothetical protein